MVRPQCSPSILRLYNLRVMRITSARIHSAPDARRASRVMHVRKGVVQRSASDRDAGATPPSESSQPGVVVSLSPAAQRAREQLELPGSQGAHGQDSEGPGSTHATDAGESVAGSGDEEAGPDGLNPKQEQVVRELAQRDREVRAHEAAHQAAGGALTGGATFTSETGPDGRQYAVGGEVSIEMSGGKTPEETIERAERIRAAALAPADPSPQDLAVAAAATQMEAQARQQLAAREKAELSPAGGSSDGSERAMSAPDAPGVHVRANAQRALAAYRSAAA